MNEDEVFEDRLRSSLRTVASSTRATDRWDEVAAQIADPAAGRDLDYVTERTPRGSGSRPLAALVAFVAVLAGAFGVASLSGDDGASSPEEAVEHLIDAVADEDPIGVLQSLAPSEREVLVPVLERLTDELEEAGVASEALDTRDLAGLDIEVGEPTMSTRRLDDDYALVEIEHVGYTGRLALADLPFAGNVMDLVGPGLRDPDPAEGSLTSVEIMTVREDGGWYVGLQASLAHLADGTGGAAVPDFTGGGIPARGATSPEAAAREMTDAIYAGDVTRMVELTPADESGALHVWGPVLAEARRREGGTTQIDRLQLTIADGADGAKVARPGAYRWRYVDEEGSRTVVSDGRCVTSSSTYVGDGRTEPVGTTLCPTATDPLMATFATANALIGWSQPPVLSLVERDGQWFVSPIRSVAETMFDAIEGLGRDDALRVARSYFGDAWAVAPIELWEACGMARPAADTAGPTGARALQRCQEQLPEDYVGPFSQDASFFTFGPRISVGSTSPPPPDDELVGTTTVVATTGPPPSVPTTTTAP